MPTGCAGFGFRLGDDATLVDGAALGLRLDFWAAGLDLVVGAEERLPRGVVGSWGACPAVCVSCTVALTVGCSPSSRAIAVIRVLSITIPYRA